MKIRKKKSNIKGFTLIELMIVIAIIGILAAIAIPNFISYRDKSYCKGAESDANSIAARIADYYSVPTRIGFVTLADIGGTGNLTNHNTATIAGSINNTITIHVTESTGRCPAEYRTPMNAAANPLGFWAGTGYTKIMR